MIMTTVIYLVDNFILCLYSLYAVCCWIGGWLIWFHRLWKPKATGQRNNGSAVHWRHRIVPTRKCQIHESIVNLAVNLLLREIKLCSFTNLINQKFSDSASLLAIAVSSVALKSCQLWIHKVLFTYLRPFQKSFHCTCWLWGTIFD